MRGNYYGAVNIGGGWGPPPLAQGLLLQDREMQKEGVSGLGRIIGGIVNGATQDPQASTGKKIKTALFQGLMQANPEYEARNKMFRGLQEVLESGYGVPKTVTNSLSLEQAQGLLKAQEINQANQQQARDEELKQQQLDILRQYRQDQINQQAAATRARFLGDVVDGVSRLGEAWMKRKEGGPLGEVIDVPGGGRVVRTGAAGGQFVPEKEQKPKYTQRLVQDPITKQWSTTIERNLTDAEGEAAMKEMGGAASPAPAAPNVDDLRKQAQDAIRRGATRDAVAARFKELTGQDF